MLTFAGAGPGRVAEHTVGAHRPHAAGAQHRHDLGQGPDVASSGLGQLHGVRVQREHHRGLGPAGVRVTAGQPGVPARAGASLVAKPADGRLHRRNIPAVPVDQEHSRPVQAGVPAQFDQARGQRLGADG
jgi:hypothetical protein